MDEKMGKIKFISLPLLLFLVTITQHFRKFNTECLALNFIYSYYSHCIAYFIVQWLAVVLQKETESKEEVNRMENEV